MPKRQRVQESTDSGEDCRLWWHCGEDEWYAASVQHWNARDVDVLGGLDVNNVDIEGSLSFLQEALGERWTAKGDSDPPPMPGSYALDVGAGCGRVTGGLLLRAFERVHMLEVSDSLLAKAARALVAHSARLDTTRASLASFRPPLGVYDAIWAQWILGHLTDTSVVQLLRACRAALKPGGFIIVKENNAPPRLCSEGNGRYLIDQENAAVLRTHAHHLALFRQAGCTVVASRRQTSFSKDLFPVRMYLLKELVGGRRSTQASG